MNDPRTDLVRVAKKLIREAEIHPQANGDLIVLLPFHSYISLENILSVIDDAERATRAAKAQAPAPARPAAESPAPVP